MANGRFTVANDGRRPCRQKDKIVNFACLLLPQRIMKHLTRYIDLAFCLLVLPVMALLFPVERWFHYFPWYVVSVGLWLYAVYFINRLVVVPWLFGSRYSRLRGVGLMVLSVAVTYLLAKIQWYVPKPNVLDNGIVRIFSSVTHHQQAVWSLFVIVETYSVAVGLLTQANEQRARRRQLEAEREKAEIGLYKAQIKPHFMFNTLNSLYGLFLTGNDKALESLEKFISMMRYIHVASSRDMVSLSDESDYIRRYVELQSLRLNEMTEVSLDISVDNPGLPVPPMLLVTFVENCFKHGVSSVEHGNISISLSEKDGRLVLTTSNRIFPVKRIGEHMGIENCRKRLALLYPGTHDLVISNDGETFAVKLIIEIK